MGVQPFAEVVNAGLGRVRAEGSGMGTELAADAAEVIWGVISLVLLIALIGGVVYLVSQVSRKVRQRDEQFQRVEARLNTLEEKADRSAE